MDEGSKVVTYEYRFDRAAPLDAVRETLVLSVLGAENLHGPAKVRLDGRFRLDTRTRRCVLDASTEVGEDIARLFTGYLSREFGDGVFSVTRTAGRRVGAGKRHGTQQTASLRRQHAA